MPINRLDPPRTGLRKNRHGDASIMSSSIPAAAAVAAATVADEGPPEPPQQLEQEQEQEQEQRPRDKGEEEATARLAVYMDAALPYSPDDWVRVNCQGCLHNKRCVPPFLSPRLCFAPHGPCDQSP